MEEQNHGDQAGGRPVPGRDDPPVALGSKLQGSVTPSRPSYVYRASPRFTSEYQSEPSFADGWGRATQPGAEPGPADAVRTWAGIVVGGLAGVLIVLVALLLLRPGYGQQAGASPKPELPVVTGTGTQAVQAIVTPGDLDRPALATGPFTERLAPDFELETLDGKTVRLSDFRGKPVWINFWATWCPPCRAEMPEMQQKYAKLKETGMIILGVDVAEEPQRVRGFTQDGGFQWTFLLDRERDVSQKYSVTGLPTHFFVGRDGVIKAIQVGGLPGNLMDRYADLITK